jgi:RHS repeat-associated protein
MYLPEKSVTSVSTDSKQREVGYLGKQVFELSNHLGNILATITDKKLQVSLNTTSTGYFEADVQTVQDYYAFGMQMPGRKLSGGYRYGFNGKENDNEVKGEGNQQDYGMRIYDGRIGKFLSVDPLAHLREWVSPYNFVQNNPINRVDPTGALDDWVQDADGNIKWDKDANSQETTKAGEKYLGKTLTFTFNSYIDRKLWDGPGGSSPAGDKLTSTISLTGNENEAGELTSLSATKSVKIGETPIGTARDYFPGLGSDQNKFGFNRTTLNFEQHASVSPIEGFGLGLMGYDIVNVAQKLTLSLSGNNLSVTAATDIFPSATLAMNGSQMMYYPQPSFKGTHGYQKRTVFGDNGMGGSTTTEYTPLRPAPSFHIRFKK